MPRRVAVHFWCVVGDDNALVAVLLEVQLDRRDLRPVSGKDYCSLTRAGIGINYFLSPGLIKPGSVTDDGSRVTDYAAWFLFDSMKFKYSEITYE